jgi:acetyl-CoA synthetase
MLHVMSGDRRGLDGGAGPFRPADVLTHRQLLHHGDQAARALKELGVGDGDAVVVLLPMCLESVAVTLACVRLRALRVTLPVAAHPGELGRRIRQSGARVVVTADASRIDGAVLPVKARLDRELAGAPDIAGVLVVPQVPRPVPWVPGRDRWWPEALGLAGAAPAGRPYPGGMSGTHDATDGTHDTAAAAGAGPRGELVFDDPLDRRASDDTDHGWGDRPADDAGADLLRLLREKPPHHL